MFRHHLHLLTLLSGMLVLPFFSLHGQTKHHITELKRELKNAPYDTAKVRLLFQMGNRFIDGPSDSLSFYYGKALELIHYKLSVYNKNVEDNRQMILAYRRLEMRAYIELGIEYFFRSNYDKALEYYFKALKIAEETGDEETVSECQSEIAIVYKNQGKYDLALKYNRKALDYARFSGDSSWAAVCYANQGTIYLMKGYFNLALNNYLTALKTFEKLDQKRRMGACYLNVGKIYAGQRDDNQAIKYYRLALANARKTGNNMNMADSYMSMGKVWLDRQQPATARICLDSAMTVLKESGYTHRMDDCFMLIGDTYKMDHRYDKAEEYYGRSLELSTRENDLPGMSGSLRNMAETEYLKNNLSKALAFGQRSLDIARKTGNPEALQASWEILSKIYEAGGDDTKALAAFKMYSVFKDSLFNESKYRSIREAEAKYETEKKEQQLALLTQKSEVQQLKLSRRRNLLFASGAGIVLALLFSFLLVRQNRIQSKQKAILLEQRLLRSQMNPHFIFNSLIAIQSYIYNSEPLQAGDFLAKFADLIRLTLEHSRVEFVPLNDELRMLTAYLDLQVLRFDNKFDYTLTVDKKPGVESVKVPPMFAQPFVENAIEHGLRYKQGRGHLNIIYEKTSDRCMTITVEDDGVGRKKAAEIEKKNQHRSRAMKITQERLAVLTKKYRHKFTLEVDDIKNKSNNVSGTRVSITLPFQFTEND